MYSCCTLFFFFKQKTAYEMRISDWSSDVCSSDLLTRLTAEMEFDGGRSVKHYKHRLLLMLDEFTSVGKLEIFEDALAYMAGYGLKAFIIVQDQIGRASCRERVCQYV